jgi:hypothetical protein
VEYRRWQEKFHFAYLSADQCGSCENTRLECFVHPFNDAILGFGFWSEEVWELSDKWITVKIHTVTLMMVTFLSCTIVLSASSWNRNPILGSIHRDIRKWINRRSCSYFHVSFRQVVKCIDVSLRKMSALVVIRACLELAQFLRNWFLVLVS